MVSVLIDLAVIAAAAGLLFGFRGFAGHWTSELRPTVEIDLSPWALPRYAFYSLSRGLLAYVFSLTFTLLYGYWAAKDKLAERVLLPLLDVLQSIPVLGFMPGLVLALVSLFPRSNMGLELAAVVMIFTGQAWNMTFSFYHSLKSVPPEQREVASLYRFGPLRTLRRVELPFATTGLVYNSMMSMAGGWFFLMVNEAFVLGDKDFRLPGLGAYMSVAAARGDNRAMVFAMIAMVVMIASLDQVVWRPLVVWAQKFRVEDSASQVEARSWFYDVLHGSPTIHALRRWVRRAITRSVATARAAAPNLRASDQTSRGQAIVTRVLFVVLVGLLALGGVRVVGVLAQAPPGAFRASVVGSGLTLSRVLVSTALGTLWTVPAGLWIGLSPRASRVMQPVVQIAASFPAPMLFPAVTALLHGLGVKLDYGSVVLMLLGTQWYILFNVIAGAAAIPADLLEVATSYRFSTLQKLRTVYLPAVFPFLVTGWVTAAGGAWNASIVSEYVQLHGETLTAHGLGAVISVAAEHADFPSLATSVGVMSIVVILFNRTVWRWCYSVAERKFSLNK
jgi:NitT/TauT family transport system permease protein